MEESCSRCSWAFAAHSTPRQCRSPQPNHLRPNELAYASKFRLKSQNCRFTKISKQNFCSLPRGRNVKFHNDATLIVQNWLVSELLANIFRHVNLAEERKLEFLKIFAKIRNYDFVEIIFSL